jgi:hypothetical protein
VISKRELKAAISASDVANASTAWITVNNPGVVTSNTIFFPITNQRAQLGMATNSVQPPGEVATVGDFNNDGKLDVDWNGPTIMLGNGKGGFSPPIINQVRSGVQLLTGDFNGDGKLDIAEVDVGGFVTVLLGGGDGTLTESWTYQARGGGNTIAVGDFNQDGHLDLFISGYDLVNRYFGIAFGKGDGTFSSPTQQMVGYYPGIPAVGDFNSDGILDLAITESRDEAIDVFLGDGNGGFQELGAFTAFGEVSAVAADLNHDGNLDLVTDSGCVYLGNGNGLFSYSNCAVYSGSSIGVGDFDGNGSLDLPFLTVEAFSLFLGIDLGVGDGTFFSSSPLFPDGAAINTSGGASGDFNNDGQLDAVANGYLLLQAPMELQPISLSFGNQAVGTSSQPQSATLTNVGTTELQVGIGITAPTVGTGPGNFSQTNNCGSSLAGGASCTIMVTFQPKVVGTFSPFLTVRYPGGGSPQKIALSGSGLSAPEASLQPTSLSFPVQVYGTSSQAQAVSLTNIGGQPLVIANIAITGAFSQTNDCPATLAPGSSCSFEIVFTPNGSGTLTGTLSVSDNATGSPQSVTLSGTGTVVVFSPIAINFGNQKVGTSSPSVPIQLSDVSPSALSITQIAIGGADPADFSQTNNCPAVLPGNSSCTINVVFTPQTKGARSASVVVTDNGGASPQSVPLSGDGT